MVLGMGLKGEELINKGCCVQYIFKYKIFNILIKYWRDIMGYFGGLGAGKGWNKYFFIITPDEFKKIFDIKSNYVINNQRMPIEYTSTSFDELVSNYSKYYQKIKSGTIFDQKTDWDLATILYISFVHDMKLCEYEICPDPKYKLIDFIEPFPSISPFAIHRWKTRIAVDIANPEGYIGLGLYYPKFVSYDHENYEYIHSTPEYIGFKVYNDLVNKIKSITVGCKMKFDNILRRPRIKISPNSIDDINNNEYLSRNKIVVLPPSKRKNRVPSR